MFTLAVPPRPLRRRISPAQAAEALARGLERRAPRVHAPRAWALPSLARGLAAPLDDARLARDPRVRGLLRAAEETPPREL